MRYILTFIFTVFCYYAIGQPNVKPISFDFTLGYQNLDLNSLNSYIKQFEEIGKDGFYSDKIDHALSYAFRLNYKPLKNINILLSGGINYHDIEKSKGTASALPLVFSSDLNKQEIQNPEAIFFNLDAWIYSILLKYNFEISEKFAFNIGFGPEIYSSTFRVHVPVNLYNGEYNSFKLSGSTFGTQSLFGIEFNIVERSISILLDSTYRIGKINEIDNNHLLPFRTNDSISIKYIGLSLNTGIRIYL